ncbi:hypothetical protein ATANTOWER_015657 [Ataeniobius toweri]|uniref:Uncharacterized protein n=1 Tax=Ataeniobius toweri TaxID=208326 RepID=A0ABU7BSV1_9TELE|nr:hypothetical protein [Ataeniobius toweri]
MDQCEDREEGVPPSETTLCGEHESQSKGQRIHQRLKPEPEPSCVSFKSDWSMGHPTNFRSPGSPSSDRIHPRLRPKHDPEPICVSLKSDWSKNVFINFQSGQPSAAERALQRFSLRIQQRQEYEDESSCVSLKSNMSKHKVIDLKSDQTSAAER